jgi:hypothetical protein
MARHFAQRFGLCDVQPLYNIREAGQRLDMGEEVAHPLALRSFSEGGLNP